MCCVGQGLNLEKKLNVSWFHLAAARTWRMMRRVGTSRQGLVVAFMLVFELAACESSETTGGSVASAEPSGAQTSEAEESNDLPGARLFASPNVLHFAFTLPAENWTQLSEHGDEEAYVQASVELDDPAFVASGAVGLRHKGNWTLHHCWDDFGGQRSYEEICAKLSFKVKFDEYQPEQRVDGLKRLNLHALQVDPTKCTNCWRTNSSATSALKRPALGRQR